MSNPEIKNVIFDLGAVMFDWNPEKITKNFTDDTELQKKFSLSYIIIKTGWTLIAP